MYLKESPYEVEDKYYFNRRFWDNIITTLVSGGGLIAIRWISPHSRINLSDTRYQSCNNIIPKFAMEEYCPKIRYGIILSSTSYCKSDL